MRNRAKCLKCKSVIESFHRYDFVSCSCGEISLDGGTDYLRVLAKDWANIVRIDDEGKEVPIKVVDKEQVASEKLNDVNPLDTPKPSKADKIAALKEMIKTYESMPQNAMISPCTHYDVLSVLLLLQSFFDED